MNLYCIAFGRTSMRNDDDVMPQSLVLYASTQYSSIAMLHALSIMYTTMQTVVHMQSRTQTQNKHAIRPSSPTAALLRWCSFMVRHAIDDDRMLYIDVLIYDTDSLLHFQTHIICVPIYSVRALAGCGWPRE